MDSVTQHLNAWGAEPKALTILVYIMDVCISLVLLVLQTRAVELQENKLRRTVVWLVECMRNVLNSIDAKVRAGAQPGESPCAGVLFRVVQRLPS